MPKPLPPIAKRTAHTLTAHGQKRTDPYYWLREKESAEVRQYLSDENDYAEKMMAHTSDLQDELFEEIKGRLKQDDTTAPFRDGDYWYYTRFETGKEYPIHCRKFETLEASEEVLLDVNELAKNHTYFDLRDPEVSEDHRLLAYGVDTSGDRVFTLTILNLTDTSAPLEIIEHTAGSAVWANDHRTLFYTRQDNETLREHQVWRHTLGTDQASDTLVYEEMDDTFSCYIAKSRSKAFILIGCYQTLTSEYHTIDANRPNEAPMLFLPRKRDHEYDLDHFEGRFYVRSNHEATNFRLLITNDRETMLGGLTELIAHRDDVLYTGAEMFDGHLVIEERSGGKNHLRIVPWTDGNLDTANEHYLDFGEDAYTAHIDINPMASSNHLRYSYSSLTTPDSIYDYDMLTGQKRLLKQDEIGGGFDSANYVSRRLFATTEDGTLVPISLVHRKGLVYDGTNPLLLYAYGSYGITIDADFGPSIISLLDRGFVFAIAHVRGGEMMGRRWYDDGKLLKKKNTFTDFIACAEHLIGERYTSPERLFARGGSAGGLLMGAIINMRPELFKGISTRVPWVDVVTTMLDADIPLTTGEYDEWGDPADRTFYDYMLSYSPYDNVTAQAYPHMLVTTSLNDSQVQYWEPAKWVAKLRSLKTDDHRLLLKTDMEAGHSGGTGRFTAYQEQAYYFAFLLDLVDQSSSN